MRNITHLFFKTRTYLFLFLFTVFSILIRGYNFGTGNQIHYFTYVMYYLHPTLYPFDYLLKTHTIPYTIYIDVVKYFVSLTTSYQLVVFFAYFVVLYLYYLGIFLITQLLSKSTKVAFFSLLFFLYPIPIGGSTIFTVESSLIPRSVAETFFILALYFLFTKRSFVSAIFAAIGFLFHPLTLLPYPIVVLYLGLNTFLPWKKIFLGAGTFALLVFPFVAKFFAQDSHVSPIFDQKWFSVIFERMPYVFVYTWSFWDFILIGCIPIFFLFYEKLIKKKITIHPVAVGMIIASLLLFYISLISNIAWFRLGIQLQLPRNLYALILFCLIYLALLIQEKAKKIPFSLLYGVTLSLFVLLCLSQRQFDGLLWIKKPTSYEQLALWAKSHTPNNSIFVVPVEDSGFRFWSNRSVFVEQKEGGDGLYDRNFALEWDMREDFLEKHQLNNYTISLLKTKYHITDIVTTQTFNLPILHQVKNWKIYHVG